MKGEDQGRKQDERGPVFVSMETSVDPSEAQVSLLFSLPVRTFPALRLPSKGSRTCLPAAKVCQPRVRARTMPRGQAEMGGVGVYSAHFRTTLEFRGRQKRKVEIVGHRIPLHFFFFSSSLSHSNFGIEKIFIISSCI